MSNNHASDALRYLICNVQSGADQDDFGTYVTPTELSKVIENWGNNIDKIEIDSDILEDLRSRFGQNSPQDFFGSIPHNPDFKLPDYRGKFYRQRDHVSSKDLCSHQWKKDYYFSLRPYETCSKCGKKKEDV